MKVQDLTKEELHELIDCLQRRPSYVTALDKLMLANYLKETLLKEDKDAVSSTD